MHRNAKHGGLSMSSASAIARAQQALEAGRRARVVGHARLMPACDDDAAQMRFAVEDALNTADFGDAGRLVLVRRLKLADLPPRASPALVARAMESAWRSMALRAVPGGQASAARAEAVFFPSRFEARMAWLAKVAGGDVPVEWFWPVALLELKALPHASTGAAIECVIEVVLRDNETAVVSALKRWHDAPLTALVRAMPANSLRRLMRALVSSAGTASRAPAALLVARVQAAKALPQPLVAVARRLATWVPMEEAPANLLAALWLEPVLHRLPTMDEVAAVASRAVWMAGQALAETSLREQPVRASLRRTSATSIAEASEADERDADVLTDRSPAEPVTHEAAVDQVSQPATWKIESGLASQTRRTAKVRAVRVDSQLAWPWLADAAFTHHGGLMLVLNVLAALRFNRWLQGVEAGDRLGFVQALLLHCLDVAGAREDDPQRAWLDASARLMDSGVRRNEEVSVAPPSFRRTPESIAAATQSTIRLWTLRLRRTLRRHARMDLADLVRRDAWVSATPTHIDVIFAMDDVDMRLRRLGLDADPGWVPWFGRIVNFHFIDAQMLPPAGEDGHG